MIENGKNMWETAEEVSYAGYTKDIVKPIDLAYCKPESLIIRYKDLADIPISEHIRRTGCEMAIKYYNCERKKENDFFETNYCVDGRNKGKRMYFPKS